MEGHGLRGGGLRQRGEAGKTLQIYFLQELSAGLILEKQEAAGVYVGKAVNEDGHICIRIRCRR